MDGVADVAPRQAGENVDAVAVADRPPAVAAVAAAASESVLVEHFLPFALGARSFLSPSSSYPSHSEVDPFLLL